MATNNESSKIEGGQVLKYFIPEKISFHLLMSYRFLKIGVYFNKKIVQSGLNSEESINYKFSEVFLTLLNYYHVIKLLEDQ